MKLMSRVGKKPIIVPETVKVGLEGSRVKIKGPKGELEHILPEGVSVQLENEKIFVRASNESKSALWGLTRALIANMIIGLTEGFSKQLEIVGVGWNAQVKEKILLMKLGFSHPVNFPIPEDIKIQTPKPTQILVSGIDKQKVGEVSAAIRGIFPPEPYKGKGIRYAGEQVRKKLGKKAAGTK